VRIQAAKTGRKDDRSFSFDIRLKGCVLYIPLYLQNSLGRGKAVDLSAVAAVTEGLSGAELEYIVNEAAIRAVRRVSVELNQGVDKTKVDTTVYTKDFEASVKSFFESRNAKKKSKAFGIMVPSGAERWKTNNARPPNQIFIT
jgi:ATP-dependent Zn protease